MERKRLRVDGIPTDIPAERAKDKLTIHFLRTRNGGGEVEDIEIFSGHPPHAIITFEDDRVVDCVLKIKDHFLKINNKTYNLEVSEVPGKLELDEVFKRSSLSVNYKILPKKLKDFLRGLRETYKEVKFDFDDMSYVCEISGSYTKIHALSQEIIKKIEFNHEHLKEDSSKTHSKAQSDQSTLRKHFFSQAGVHPSSKLYAPAENVGFFPRGENADRLGEPFVWDSDIFKYIKQFHSFQYKEILNKCNVQAVEESCDEITTIILQSSLGSKDCVTNLRNAQIELMGLYQGLERVLRKEQIDKKHWTGDKNIFGILLKDLKRKFPMLLCHENDQYIFFVGSSGDVALGKHYIIDTQLKLNNPSSFVPSYDTQSAGGHLSTEVGQREFMSHSFKHDYSEAQGGSRIAATLSSFMGSHSYLSSHPDEKSLSSSSSSSSKLHLDLERSQDSNKTLGATDFATSASINPAEDCSFSQVSETASSKGLAPVKKMDVLPALKTGRIDIRQSKSTSKSVGKITPVRIIKASSDLAYSSLVDAIPQSLDFKPTEVKLRRSSSFSNIYTKDSSDHQDGTSQLKEEMFMENWLWHYMKEFHKLEIDTWCAEVQLTEENFKESAVLKLKSFNKTKLWSAKQRILLLYKETRDNFTKSCFQYSVLGFKGPGDSALQDLCSAFYNCCSKLCVKLEKDALVLVYPKVTEKRILEEYRHFLINKNKNSDTLSSANDSQKYLVTVTKEEENEPYYSGQNETEHRVKYLGRDYLKDPEDFHFESDKSEFIKRTEDDKTSPAGGQNKMIEDKAIASSFFPALQNENIQKPHQLQETQDYLKSDIFLQDQDRIKSKSSDLEKYQAYVHESPLEQKMDSSSNLSEPRRPAVGQESDSVDGVCDHCKRNGKTSTLACGHYMCDNCASTFRYTCSVCHVRKGYKKNALNAMMTSNLMTLSIPGYGRDNSIKIKYEVPNGVQRAEDPHPGKPYTGGIFSAYLPDNSEGRKLVSLYEKALNQNLIFYIKPTEHGDFVAWHAIPHKTSVEGGKSKKGYPDSQYMKETIALMKTFAIE